MVSIYIYHLACYSMDSQPPSISFNASERPRTLPTLAWVKKTPFASRHQALSPGIYLCVLLSCVNRLNASWKVLLFVFIVISTNHFASSLHKLAEPKGISGTRGSTRVVVVFARSRIILCKQTPTSIRTSRTLSLSPAPPPNVLHINW
jgi:hypothetical protein